MRTDHRFLAKALLTIALTLALLPRSVWGAPQEQRPSHSFTVVNGQFVLDGRPFQILSGEMHYPRIPREYWRDRFRMAKAMGLNTVTTYVFWNVHEAEPGKYDFSGNNDVAEFIREAQQEGLYVVLRPGPYICAEWEFGGYPAWLLKNHDMVVRSQDPRYTAAVDRWISRLGKELAPLQIGNGGPIILVQVENEYGSFGEDRAYMEQLRKSLLDAGFTASQLYTADGPEVLATGSLPELPAAINFGASDAHAAEESFSALKQFRPGGPFFNSEFWAGWFDHWGSPHAYTDTAKQRANLRWILGQGYSVSLYMFHGGTSFGWMNGANSDGKNYEPDVTSYDYDAALDESGRPTSKYFEFRELIRQVTGTTPPPVPATRPTISLPEFKLPEAVSLWDTLPAPIHSDEPLSMEDLDQAYGYILYRTKLVGPVQGELELNELHDYAQVFVDRKLVGTLDRRLGQNRLLLEVNAPTPELDILVENTGRINFTIALRGERKGITKQVTLARKPLLGWEIYPLPLHEPSGLAYSQTACTGDCFYRGSFNVDVPGDTFLDTRAFRKGQVWVNGHALGRVWSIGPQKTLYLPGPWLHKGENVVVVFDLDGTAGGSLIGRNTPILGSDVQWLMAIVMLHRRLSELAALGLLLAALGLLLVVSGLVAIPIARRRRKENRA